MKISHKFVIFSSLGFGMGVIIGVMICAFSATLTYSDGTLYLCSKELIEAVGNPLTAFTIQAFTSGLYGILAMGGSVVYSIEKWSILKCTLIHYLAVIAGFIIMAITMRWFIGKEGLVSMVITLGIMTVVYIVIWIANYLSSKSQLEQINKELDELKALEIKGVTEA